jgi:hypothetical protein
MNLKSIRRAHEEAERQFRKKLTDRIQELPDNPRSTRLAKNCFVIPFSAMGNNWSVEYHDWKRQYEIVLEVLDKHDFKTAVRQIVRIIRTGKFRITSDYPYTVTFAPEVCRYLRKVYLGGD